MTGKGWAIVGRRNKEEPLTAILLRGGRLLWVDSRTGWSGPELFSSRYTNTHVLLLAAGS